MSQVTLNESDEGNYQPESKFNELFHITQEYHVEFILLNTFINLVDTVYDIASKRKRFLLTINFKNKWRLEYFN